MRILCLHGRGTNSNIFESQLAPLISKLPKNYTFDFLDAEETSNPAPGLDGHPGPFLAWHRRHFTEDVAASHDYLSSVIDEDGPYDGVIGFSQGAATAISLLLSHQMQNTGGVKPFTFAIFICCVLPMTPSIDLGVDATEEVLGYEKKDASFFGLSEEEIAAGASSKVIRLFEPTSPQPEEEPFSPKINIPTLHLLGTKDSFLQFGQHAVNLCDSRKARVIINECGHELPRSEESLDRIALMVGEVIELSKMDC